jgi:hypothetical protein
MKSGFSSLELIMVIMVSTIIMSTVFEIYYQITRSMQRVDRFVVEDMQIFALKNRLQKDLSSMNAIWFTQGAVESKELADGKQANAPEKRKRSNYFYSVNKKNSAMLDVMTFVTTGSLMSYGATQDQFVRVVYKVEENPLQEGTFCLMRKQINFPCENIDKESLDKEKFYELISGFTELTVKMTFIDKLAVEKKIQELQKPQEVQAAGKKEEIAGVELIKNTDHWGIPDLSEGEEKLSEEQFKPQNLGGAAIPKYITLHIAFPATDSLPKMEYDLDFLTEVTLDNIPKNISIIKKSIKVPDGATASGGLQPEGRS